MENSISVTFVLYAAATVVMLIALALKVNNLVVVEHTLSMAEGFAIGILNILVIMFAMRYGINYPYVILNICFSVIIASLIFVVVLTKFREKLLNDEMDNLDIENAKRLIQSYPDNSAPYEQLGDIYRRQKKYQLSLENYQIAVKLTEGFADNSEVKGKLRSVQLDMDYHKTKKRDHEIIYDKIKDKLDKM